MSGVWQKLVEREWWAPWALGLGLRLLAAWVGIGWFAPDDYLYVLEQSRLWLDDWQAPFACDYRSPLLPRLFWLMMLGAKKAGVSEIVDELRWAYAGLGLWTSVAIIGTHKLARRMGANEAFAASALCAAYFLMPRIGTRALLESAAMVPLVWSAWALVESTHAQSARKVTLFGAAAGLLLGASAMLRFQVGILVLPTLAWLGWVQVRKHRLVALGAFAVGGSVAALLQIALDLALGRLPMQTALSYVRLNLDISSHFGVSPWYTYLLHFLVFTLPPLTLFFFKPLWASAKRHALSALWLGVFVLSHSWVGHKEDRFMFPILPLFFVLLGTALVIAWQAGGARRTAVGWFCVLNALALGVVTLSDAQRSLTMPLLAISQAGGTPRVAAIGMGRLPHFYLGQGPQVTHYSSVQDLTHHTADDTEVPSFVLTQPPPVPADHQTLQALGCTLYETYRGDWVDRLLVRFNRHNRSRQSTALYGCLHKATVATVKE